MGLFTRLDILLNMSIYLDRRLQANRVVSNSLTDRSQFS